MSVPYLRALKGELVVVGKSPDGDSIRFIPQKPELLRDLQRGDRVRITKSDGSASVSVMMRNVPTHANAVLLIYNSGGQPHGVERGHIGVDAHHQLIARPE